MSNTNAKSRVFTAAHTPGPWHVDARKQTGTSKGYAYVLVRAERALGQVATVFENHESNARLIAAAPDLLAALQRAHWALDMLTGCTLLHGESDGQRLHFKMVCDEADKARAALAKASGVQS